MTTVGTIISYLTTLALLLPAGEPLQPGRAAAELSGRVYDIVAVGSHAFAATGAGLTVFDISVKSRPSEVTTLHFPGSGNGISVSGNLAFLSLGPAGLRLIDISNPVQPAFVSFLDTDGSVNAAVAIGDNDSSLIAIADGSMGVKVARFDRNGSIEIVSHIDTGRYARHLDVQGDLLAVADEDDGVGLFHVDTTGMLEKKAVVAIPGSARGVALAGDRCFVAAGLAGLVVIDVSSPDSPILLSTLPTEEYARGLAVLKGVVYVADSGAGLVLFDRKGKVLGTASTPGVANRVSVSGETALVAADGAGIALINVSKHSKPTGY